MKEKLLEGKVALVTASAGAGIGNAVARLFAQEGAQVVVSDAHARRTQEAAEALSKEIGREIPGYELDVSNEEMAGAVVKDVQQRYGRIDILFNNAGINKLVPIWEMPAETWDFVMGITLRGQFLMTRAVLPKMIENKFGRIVNVASVAGYSGSTGGEAHYSAAKAGVMGFTRAVAAETAKHGVRVNAIAPGLIYNPFLERIYPPEFFERARASAPMGRVGEPPDIAKVALFLVSELSDYVTGEVLTVAGGTYMHA